MSRRLYFTWHCYRGREFLAGRIPRSLPLYDARKVAEWYDDRRTVGPKGYRETVGTIEIQLAPGWIFNHEPLHFCASFLDTRQAVQEVKAAIPCDCEECREGAALRTLARMAG